MAEQIKLGLLSALAMVVAIDIGRLLAGGNYNTDGFGGPWWTWVLLVGGLLWIRYRYDRAANPTP